MAEFVDLQCGERVLRVDASLCEMASERVFWREFAVNIGGAARSSAETQPAPLRDARGTLADAVRAGTSHDPLSDSSSVVSAAALTVERADVSRDEFSQDPLSDSSSVASARALAVERADVSKGAFSHESLGDSSSVVSEPAFTVERAGVSKDTFIHESLSDSSSVARAPALIVERAQVEQGAFIQAPLGECRIERSGNTLRVQVEDGVSRGELVLRLSYYLCATEQGAVLIHASAMRAGDVALVASGKSGDGKSTLSRLGTGAGLTLLTDEVVMLFPDGRVSGTPFRSDFVHAGTPGLTRARYFLALEKAPHEELKPLAALAASQLAMSQCFELSELALPRAEVRRRLLSFLSNVEPRTLAFRKDPAAGEFVRAALEMTTVTRL